MTQQSTLSEEEIKIGLLTNDWYEEFKKLEVADEETAVDDLKFIYKKVLGRKLDKPYHLRLKSPIHVLATSSFIANLDLKVATGLVPELLENLFNLSEDINVKLRNYIKDVYNDKESLLGYLKKSMSTKSEEAVKYLPDDEILLQLLSQLEKHHLKKHKTSPKKKSKKNLLFDKEDNPAHAIREKLGGFLSSVFDRLVKSDLLTTKSRIRTNELINEKLADKINWIGQTTEPVKIWDRDHLTATVKPLDYFGIGLAALVVQAQLFGEVLGVDIEDETLERIKEISFRLSPVCMSFGNIIIDCPWPNSHHVKNGDLHNIEGPAVSWEDYDQYFIEGESYSFREFYEHGSFEDLIKMEDPTEIGRGVILARNRFKDNLPAYFKVS